MRLHSAAHDLEKAEKPLDAIPPPPSVLFWRIRPFHTGVLLFILASLLTTHFISSWRDNEARFNKLRAGMTKAEVEDILGEPTVDSPAVVVRLPGGKVKVLEDFGKDYGRYGHSSWTFHDGTVNVDWTRKENGAGFSLRVMAAQWKPAPNIPTRGPLKIIQDILRKIGL